MIEYGVAILVVLALTALDRRATPFALVILAGWLAGFLGWQFWAGISLVCGLTFFWLFLKDRDRRWATVTAIEGAALFVDVLYLWFRWRGIDVGVEYANALTFGLICKLALIGSGGLWNGVVLLRSWSPRDLRRRGRMALRRLGLNGKKATAG